MNQLASNVLGLHEWIDELANSQPVFLSAEFPSLPSELAPAGTKPLEMPTRFTFMNLRMASHVAYEMAYLMANLADHGEVRTAFVLARTSIEASATALHLATQLIEHGDEAFLREGLRERIWMAHQGRKFPGHKRESIEAAVKYARDRGWFLTSKTKTETPVKFARRVASGRRVSDRVALLFPEAPQASVAGFHYGLLSGFAHANPEVYFYGPESDRFVLALGATLTALKAATEKACTAFMLPFDDRRFDVWPESLPSSR